MLGAATQDPDRALVSHLANGVLTGAVSQALELPMPDEPSDAPQNVVFGHVQGQLEGSRAPDRTLKVIP